MQQPLIYGLLTFGMLFSNDYCRMSYHNLCNYSARKTPSKGRMLATKGEIPEMKSNNGCGIRRGVAGSNLLLDLFTSSVHMCSSGIVSET